MGTSVISSRFRSVSIFDAFPPSNDIQPRKQVLASVLRQIIGLSTLGNHLTSRTNPARRGLKARWLLQQKRANASSVDHHPNSLNTPTIEIKTEAVIMGLPEVRSTPSREAASACKPTRSASEPARKQGVVARKTRLRR